MTHDDALTHLRIGAGTDLRPLRIRRQWGSAIKAQRTTLGLTVRQLAKECDVSVQAVYKWENGDAAPRPHVQADIARALGVDVSVLFRPVAA